MTSFFTCAPAPTPSEHALGVIARTRDGWRIALPSPREIARRAPTGYVPVRTLRRRMRAIDLAGSRRIGTSALAYAW